MKSAAEIYALIKAAKAESASSKVSSSAANCVSSSAIKNDSEEEIMPWDEDGWVPTSKSGKQKTPNMIRNELQRYIDECKANKTSTQTAIIGKMNVNNNSFRRFMNPKTYKGTWSATQNGTYWAAAKLLESVKYEQEESKKAAKKAAKKSASTGKRKALSSANGEDASTAAAAAAGKKAKTTTTASKATMKIQAQELVDRVLAVEGVSEEDGVFDTCPQLVTKIKEFLTRDGVTKALLLSAFGGINNNSLARFLAGKKQDQCANVSYKQGYIFFEKLRILEGKPKSASRLKNESMNPTGFSLAKDRGHWYIMSNFR
mmetsp:Transcript_31658/g.36935  ORF Transcript_31658/g.36935 Transcript_31658/m.36935 type:complete len:316 (-) Transcript_31658:247-1194(-)